MKTTDRPKTSFIHENTKVSFAVLAILIGVTAWLVNTEFTAASTAAKVEKIEVKQDKYSDDISDIKRDIAIIKEKVNAL